MLIGGRVAVVTGGASGIGEAICRSLANAGATPVAWDLEPPRGGIRCDVSDPAQVASALEETRDSYGDPTLLVTSAGIGHHGYVCDLDVASWQRVIDVNLTGTLLCIRAAAGLMRDKDLEGAIVAVSSISARLADPGMSAYCCSKAALEMLVKVAAAELGPHRIRVNAVAPGVTETPLFAESAGKLGGHRDALAERTALGRLGTPEEIAEAVLALLGTRWVTGQCLVADGGLSLYSPILPGRPAGQ